MYKYIGMEIKNDMIYDMIRTFIERLLTKY